MLPSQGWTWSMKESWTSREEVVTSSEEEVTSSEEVVGAGIVAVAGGEAEASLVLQGLQGEWLTGLDVFHWTTERLSQPPER